MINKESTRIAFLDLNSHNTFVTYQFNYRIDHNLHLEIKNKKISIGTVTKSINLWP